jgi:flagellar hook-length control protein FliK
VNPGRAGELPVAAGELTGEGDPAYALGMGLDDGRDASLLRALFERAAARIDDGSKISGLFSELASNTQPEALPAGDVISGFAAKKEQLIEWLQTQGLEGGRDGVPAAVSVKSPGESVVAEWLAVQIRAVSGHGEVASVKDAVSSPEPAANRGGTTTETGHESKEAGGPSGAPAGKSAELDPRLLLKGEAELASPARMQTPPKPGWANLTPENSAKAIQDATPRPSAGTSLQAENPQRGDSEENTTSRLPAATGALRSSNESDRFAPSTGERQFPQIATPQALATGGKGTEAEAREGGLHYTPATGLDKAGSLESGARLTDPGSIGPRGGILEQIVQKAAIHLKNGLNEVRIELKPEFLGHVRMQISAEHHQLTVRIVTELPAVKEMIEGNLQQLRAVLQQQGLKVDELEVLVADDRNRRHDPGRGATGSRLKRSAEAIGEANEQTSPPLPLASARHFGGEGRVGVDTFV